MQKPVPSRRRSCFLIGTLVLIGLCLGSLAISAASNLNLPTGSTQTERLSQLDKARLAEATHLRQSLGETVWPGWSRADIPFAVYNEEYAFLVGYADPPPGWLKMPGEALRGGAWEAVPGDTFEGQVYYRQRLMNPQITPENFTVLVGDRWAASMTTREFMEASFYRGMRADLPPLVRSVFPYRLAWVFLMGATDSYISGLEHEAFHAFQGDTVGTRLVEAEDANRYEADYPWDNKGMESDWLREMDVLVDAARASSQAEARALAGEFLQRRAERRNRAGLDANLVDYERQREWLEGLAKYAELELGRQANLSTAYAPDPGMAEDAAFKDYKNSVRFWTQQLSEARRLTGRSGEIRFYYSGFAQAALLDQLMPGWKTQAFAPGVMLEDLLRQALATP